MKTVLYAGISRKVGAFRPLEAYDQLLEFARTRGEDALRLAMHASVPQSFRADLLHLLCLNFVPEASIDCAAETDVLLAPFCEENAPMSKAFVRALETLARREKVPVVQFRKGQRKDDIAAEQRKKFKQAEGVVFIGKSQEKTPVFRTERRRNEKTGATYPWLVRSTAMVNHFYIYCVDRDFGPFFLKFCTYFPYNAKLCINGHEYAKQQLAEKGIRFEALDNGVLQCDEPKRLQCICAGLSAEKIDALLRKWLRLLPHPYSAADRKAGYRYQVSILQAEFSLTQVLDRPVTGRVFFEEVIRENVDIGRPSQVQLIFDRRVNSRTPGRFRTRVITDGVVPSLHVDYKSTRIKQYHKEGRVPFGRKRLSTILATSASVRQHGNSESRVGTRCCTNARLRNDALRP